MILINIITLHNASQLINIDHFTQDVKTGPEALPVSVF